MTPNDSPPAPAFVISIPFIISLNGLVFLFWNFSSSDLSEPAWMVNHFLVSWTGLEHGRLWILITSVFSHISFLHLLMNMFVLNSFGPVMELSLGLGRFVRFYLLAGLVSSLSHALVSAYLLRQPELPALGASGAVAGVVLLFSLMYPTQKILLIGLIPVPALVGALIFIGLDIWGLVVQAEGGGLPIGHGAHLGGSLTGILYYFIIVRPALKRAEVDQSWTVV